MKIKLVTYNIFRGQNPEKIILNITKLAAEGVNIFCLQEVYNLGKGNTITEAILAALGDNWKAEKFLSEKAPSFDLGLCTIWDSSVITHTQSEKLLLPKLAKKDFLEKMIEKTFINYQFPIQRGALSLSFKHGDKAVRITNIHLNVTGGVSHKIEQLDSVLCFLESKPVAGSEIICGDFNTLGWYRFTKNKNKKITNFLGKDFKHAFTKFTRTGPLFQVLDHIFVKNLTATKTEVRRMRGSDHYPVLVEFKI